jgi:hypothetical protein
MGSISITPIAMCMRRPTSAMTTAPAFTPEGRRLRARGLVCQGLHGCSDAVRSAALTPVPPVPSTPMLGYRISSVNGSQFFNDARAVNGSLVSKYQSPFVNVAWTQSIRTGPGRRNTISTATARAVLPARSTAAPRLRSHPVAPAPVVPAALGCPLQTGLTESPRSDRAPELSCQ